MTELTRRLRRRLLLLVPATYRELPPGDRRGRHRPDQAPGVALALRPPSVRPGDRG